MEKTYQPSAIERHWYEHWEKNDYFSPRESGEPYCIMIPPPNVTGTLHMGHAFQHTIMDALTRYHRMQGFKTLWQPGTDHAGIATQMVVERQLAADGKTRTELGREAFVAPPDPMPHHAYLERRFRRNCVVWAAQSTGRASALPWMTIYRPR